MGGIYGTFYPTENYYKDVQKLVWKFSVSPNPDWEYLRLNAQLENDCFLFAAGGFVINDFKKFQKEPIQIDIAGVDRYIIEDFILPLEPKVFLEEPWQSISIERKIVFEQELQKELGISPREKSYLRFFASENNKHILMGFEMSALASYMPSDDVLFRVSKFGFVATFATVHLTWRGYREMEGYPQVEFYDDFDDFKLKRMYSDKMDWEY